MGWCGLRGKGHSPRGRLRDAMRMLKTQVWHWETPLMLCVSVSRVRDAHTGEAAAKVVHAVVRSQRRETLLETLAWSRRRRMLVFVRVAVVRACCATLWQHATGGADHLHDSPQ